MLETLLLSVSIQAQSGAAAQTCALLAPAGEAIVFTVVPGAGGRATFVPAEGSAWPQANAAVSQAGESRGGGRNYVAGGRSGVVLDVQPPANDRRRATAMLSRWDGRNAVLPLAFGFCASSTAAPASAPSAATVDTRIAAFDPARWPDDCAMLLDDGRRVRIDYRVESATRAVTMESRDLWGGRSVAGRVRRGTSGNGVFDTSAGGPQGTEFTVLGMQGTRATRLLKFERVGDPSAPDLPGYAICGYRNLARGAAPQ